MAAAAPILIELSKLEKKLKEERLRNSGKQTLCNQLEELIEKLDVNYAKLIQIMKPEGCIEEFVDVNLVASTWSSKYDPNQTVFDNNKDTSIAKRETVEFSSKKAATNRSIIELVLPSPARRDNVKLSD